MTDRPALGAATPTVRLPVAEPSASVRDHLQALTGLRIVAALAVYFSHVRPPAETAGWIVTALQSGYAGVTVFFVLSGFVLALNYHARLRHPTWTQLWNYGVARFARVYPLYLVLLLYVLVSLRSSGGHTEGWLLHVVALQAWNPDVNVAFGMNPPAWSVSVELFLYACFPLVILALRGITSVRGLLIAVAVTVGAMVALTMWFRLSGRADLPFNSPQSDHRWLYRMPLSRLGDFVLGILAARLFLSVRHVPRVVRIGPWLAGIAAISAVAMMTRASLFYSSWSWDVLYAVPAAVLIFGLAVAPRGRLNRGLSLPLMVFLGEVSYAFYLVHYMLLTPFGSGRWATELTRSTVAFEAMTLGFVICVAIGLHIAVERPSRQWLRNTLSRRTATETPSEPDRVSPTDPARKISR